MIYIIIIHDFIRIFFSSSMFFTSTSSITNHRLIHGLATAETSTISFFFSSTTKRFK